MECSENDKHSPVSTCKGELSLREVKFLKGMRSEAGWAITRVLGPVPRPPGAEGKLCGGTHRRT